MLHLFKALVMVALSLGAYGVYLKLRIAWLQRELERRLARRQQREAIDRLYPTAPDPKAE